MPRHDYASSLRKVLGFMRFFVLPVPIRGRKLDKWATILFREEENISVPIIAAILNK